MEKNGLKILLTVLVLCIAFTVVYFLVFSRAALVCDVSFTTNLKQTDFRQLRRFLFMHGTRLTQVDLDNFTLMDQQLLEQSIQELNKYDLLILSPVVTTTCNLYDLNVSQLLPDTSSVGLTKLNRQNFDLILDPSQIEVPEDAADYRYRFADLEKKYVMIPDFVKSLEPFIKQTKEELNHKTGKLLYVKTEI